MRRFVLACLALQFAALPLLLADEPAPSTPRAEFDALVKVQRGAQGEFNRAYQAAKTKEEKDKVLADFKGRVYPRDFADSFLKLIEKFPEDPVAFDALKWLITYDAAGPAGKTALANAGDEIFKSERVLELFGMFGHGFTGPEGDRFLSRILETTPHRQVLGVGRFTQAMRLARQLDRTPAPNSAAALAAQANPKILQSMQERSEALTREIEVILDDVIARFGDVEHYPGTLKEAAEGKLFEMRHLQVGMPAPEIEGEDLAGRPLKLSDYRGQVVLLDFWGTWCFFCIADVPKQLKMLERLEGKPFVILGIDQDDDREAAKKVVAENGMSWKSWWDGSAAPITKRWNVHSWPTLYLIDAEGIIRFKGDVLRSSSVRENAAGQFEQYNLIDDRVDLLVNEALAKKGDEAK